jgi:hypothetical protein
MGRTAKPRKAYRPRPVDASPHELAMARATALQPQQRQALGQPLQQALEGLRTGQGGWDAWRWCRSVTMFACYKIVVGAGGYCATVTPIATRNPEQAT